MTTTPDDFTALRRACARALYESGQFGAPWVREAFEAVPREAFTPFTMRISAPGYPVVNRADDPSAWARAVYDHDRALITQTDDGEGNGTPNRLSSSLSSLRVVARQLSHLDLLPGQKVLHIGTGTGYDSALLAERTGAHNVVTVEVDTRLSATARRSLTAAGYGRVRTATADGVQGWAPGAPYDRILSTASALHVPPAWIEQTAPGGLILTPYRGLALIRLTVTDDGRTASGPVVDEMSFMPLRSQRTLDLADIGPVVDATLPRAEKVRTDIDFSPLETLGAEFVFHVLVPDAGIKFGTDTWWFQSRDGSSWAAWKKDGRGRQWGPRRLLDEAGAAVTRWHEAGGPALTELGVTAGSEGERVWVRRDNGLSWPAH